MALDVLIQQRLVAVETAVAEIQRRPGNETPAQNWVERVSGSFKDEPAFGEVVAYGRALR